MIDLERIKERRAAEAECAARSRERQAVLEAAAQEVYGKTLDKLTFNQRLSLLAKEKVA